MKTEKVMFKRMISLVLACLIGMLVLAQGDGVTAEYFSDLGDKHSYKFVVEENNSDYCALFLTTFPDSKYRNKVNALYDQLYYINAFDKATSTFELSDLKAYLVKFPEGEHREKAGEAIDIISYQKAKSDNTIEAYQDYLKEFPNGRARDLAQKSIEVLKQ